MKAVEGESQIHNINLYYLFGLMKIKSQFLKNPAPSVGKKVLIILLSYWNFTGGREQLVIGGGLSNLWPLHGQNQNTLTV